MAALLGIPVVLLRATGKGRRRKRMTIMTTVIYSWDREVIIVHYCKMFRDFH
jgi:hypothetical protein